MSGSCGSRLSAVAAKSWPTTSTFAPASFRMKAISGGARRQFTGVRQARAFRAPIHRMKKSSLPLQRTPTRSPGFTPAAIRALAQREESASTSA